MERMETKKLRLSNGSGYITSMSPFSCVPLSLLIPRVTFQLLLRDWLHHTNTWRYVYRRLLLPLVPNLNAKPYWFIVQITSSPSHEKGTRNSGAMCLLKVFIVLYP